MTQTQQPPGIDIRDAGPIVHVHIPCPEGGGVVTLEGENGVGKSTAIAAVHALAGGDDALTVRDGAEEGLVSGLGARLRLARRRDRGGELVVTHLESDLDPGLLIDPGLKNPESADMERARVLCALADVRPDLTLFEAVLPAEYLQQTAGPKARAATSLPEMTKFLKLNVEESARQLEQAAELEATKAMTMAANLGDVSDSEPHDSAQLADAYETAVRILSRAEGEATAAARRRKNLDDAQSRLDALAKAHGGRTTVETREACVVATDAAAVARARATELGEATRMVKTKASSDMKASDEQLQRDTREAQRVYDAAIEAAQENHRDRLSDTQRAVSEAEGAERTAVTAAQAAEDKLASAAREHKSATDAEAALGGLRATVDAGAGESGPTADELASLRARVDAASKAKDRGAVVREALRQQQEAVRVREQADKLKERALAAREAAGALWGVVASAVARIAPSGLRFVDGRVRLTTDRGDELFADLSDGERGKVAIHACIAAVARQAEGSGRLGLLPMEQHVWEGLDPVNRAYTNEEAKKHNVLVVTAIATNGPLRARVFNP